MTRLTPAEIKALRQRYTPQKPKLFKVYSCNVVVYENEDVRLCWWYIQNNNLKTKPTLK